MKRLFPTLLAAALVLPLVSQADDAADKAQIQQIEKKCAAALVKSDVQALGDIFSSDWLLVANEGPNLTRAQIFQVLQNGDLKFSGVEVGEMEVRVYADTAVVIGENHSKGEWSGQKFASLDRYTDVFVRQAGQWRCVVTHNSSVPEEEKK